MRQLLGMDRFIVSQREGQQLAKLKNNGKKQKAQEKDIKLIGKKIKVPITLVIFVLKFWLLLWYFGLGHSIVIRYTLILCLVHDL